MKSVQTAVHNLKNIIHKVFSIWSEYKMCNNIIHKVFFYMD